MLFTLRSTMCYTRHFWKIIAGREEMFDNVLEVTQAIYIKVYFHKRNNFSASMLYTLTY